MTKEQLEELKEKIKKREKKKLTQKYLKVRTL